MVALKKKLIFRQFELISLDPNLDEESFCRNGIYI